MSTMTYYHRIEQVREANATRGHHFFEPATMRFFDSRILSRVVGGRYFVTSERFDETTPRLYTIRKVNDDGEIDTVGEFQAYRSSAEAYKAAERLVRAEIQNS